MGMDIGHPYWRPLPLQWLDVKCMWLSNIECETRDTNAWTMSPKQDCSLLVLSRAEQCDLLVRLWVWREMPSRSLKIR